MTNVIIMGHGEYGSMMKSNIQMLIGEINGYHFIDFKASDNVEILRDKINQVIETLDDDKILFACDLTGGTPFREACLLASNNDNYVVVGGLNTTAYAEMAFNLTKLPKELADIGVEAAKGSIMIFKKE